MAPAAHSSRALWVRALRRPAARAPLRPTGRARPAQVWQFHEALYFIVVTYSTVGYGAFAPSAAEARLGGARAPCAAPRALRRAHARRGVLRRAVPQG